MSINKTAIFLALGLLASASCNAWYGTGVSIGFGGNTYYHGDDITVYNPGGYGPYPRGYYGGGPTIIVPNIIINQPVRRYRPRVCEEVEVCDSYDECWLERYCD